MVVGPLNDVICQIVQHRLGNPLRLSKSDGQPVVNAFYCAGACLGIRQVRTDYILTNVKFVYGAAIQAAIPTLPSVEDKIPKSPRFPRHPISDVQRFVLAGQTWRG